MKEQEPIYCFTATQLAERDKKQRELCADEAYNGNQVLAIETIPSPPLPEPFVLPSEGEILNESFNLSVSNNIQGVQVHFGYEAGANYIKSLITKHLSK